MFASSSMSGALYNSFNISEIFNLNIEDICFCCNWLSISMITSNRSLGPPIIALLTLCVAEVAIFFAEKAASQGNIEIRNTDEEKKLKVEKKFFVSG